MVIRISDGDLNRLQGLTNQLRAFPSGLLQPLFQLNQVAASSTMKKWSAAANAGRTSVASIEKNAERIRTLKQGIESNAASLDAFIAAEREHNRRVREAQMAQQG